MIVTQTLPAMLLWETIVRLTSSQDWRVVLLTKATAAGVKSLQVQQKPRHDILVTTPMRLVHNIQAGVVSLDRFIATYHNNLTVLLE